MTSLFDLDNSSDSEDDFDYEPPAYVLSSEDEEPIPSSDDEKETKRKSRKRKKNTEAVLNSSKEPLEESKSGTSEVDVKKKADDVYKSFLEEVAAETKDPTTESMSSGISGCESNTSSPVVLSNEKSSCQSSAISTPEKLFEFAGETVSVVDGTVKSLDSASPNISHSKEEKQTTASVSVVSHPVKRKGLESVLGTIQNKKQKITVLQKSLLDWKSFKKDEGLEEELEKFNRGKGGFIERQRFLERSDVRSYEIERDMRLSKRPTQTKKTT